MHLSSRCVPLLGLVLLMQLSVGAGQTTMEPTPDPRNSCRFRGQLFQPDPNVPLKVIPSPVCVEVYCNQTECGASVDYVVVRGEDGCQFERNVPDPEKNIRGDVEIFSAEVTYDKGCELNGRLVPSGYTRDMGNCSQHECTSTGLGVGTSPQCPPGSVSVVFEETCKEERCSNSKKCITVFPLTTNFTTAIAYCREIYSVLVRPFDLTGLSNQRLMNAIGQVNGWLGAARGLGESGQPWPSDGLINAMPSSFWYNDTPIFLRNASGCMGYRFDQSSGGWHQYSCTDQLQPICQLTLYEACHNTRCLTSRRGMLGAQHGEIRPTSSVCLNKKCWYGHQGLVKDPMCCTLEEPAGNTTAISLHQEGTFDTALQICTCREAELTCGDRLIPNYPGSVSPP